MGKVIPFERNKKARDTNETPCTRSQVVLGLEEEFSAVGVEIDPVLKIRAYLSTLRGVVSKNAIATGRRSLKDFSADDLKVIARDSNEGQ